jgi:hypothetical protein
MTSRSKELWVTPTPKHPLQITIRTLKEPDFKFELLPLHSPLLRQSLLVSFPPLIDMLKFSGYPYLIRGRAVISKKDFTAEAARCPQSAAFGSLLPPMILRGPEREPPKQLALGRNDARIGMP